MSLECGIPTQNGQKSIKKTLGILVIFFCLFEAKNGNSANMMSLSYALELIQGVHKILCFFLKFCDFSELYQF